MADHTREHFNITQERLAWWLGVNRTTLALSETGQRNMPSSFRLQAARLHEAARGQALTAEGALAAAPPPLPPPAPDAAPLTARLRHCRHLIRNQQYTLERMRERAAPYEARLAALPALRAWTGPVPHPTQEENWLALFEAEAVEALGNDCGAGPRRLLEARIAGLEREAELLEEILSGITD